MARRIVGSVFREKKWKCVSCGAEVAGRDIACPSCGNRKDDEETYVTANTPEVVRDPELIAVAKAGANTTCPNCGGECRADAVQCFGCGASLEKDAPKPVRAAPQMVDEPLPAAPRTLFGASVIMTGLAIFGAAVVVILGVWLLMPHEVEAKVSTIAWKYEVQLKDLVTLHEEDWDSPIDAYNVRCEQRQHGTEDCKPHDCNPHKVDCNPYKCNPHQERCNPHDCNCTKSVGDCHDLDNGFEECDEVVDCDTCYDECTEYDTCYEKCTEYDTCYEQCPVYDDWCAYDRDRWLPGLRDTTAGTSHDVHWPTLDAHGDQQRAKKTEQYTVTFLIDGEPHTFAPTSLTEFTKYTPGEAWIVNLSMLGSVEPLHTLQSQ